MTLLRSLAGMLIGELISADPAETIRIFNDCGIRLYNVEWQDALTVRFRFQRRDRGRLYTVCEKRGDRLKITGREGVYWAVSGLIQRPVLVSGVLLGLFLTLWLPTRVLFLSVEGNECIPARQILAAAEECGIRFGVSRRAVRSEKMKNALLGALPELKWAGVNTAGCTAVISVREREPKAEEAEKLSFSNVVALRDGFITSCVVTRGNLLCGPGQVVTEGQLLISGFTDCGICIRAEAADGEIFAQTNRNLTVITPSDCTVRTEPGESKRQYSLILGKKRINLWKDSGICDATCGRMYEEYYITLPGGFRLPAALAVETITPWQITTGDLPPEAVVHALPAFAQAYVMGQMKAGRILREDTALTQEQGYYCLQAHFVCEEMIGRVITEEIGDTNDKTD